MVRRRLVVILLLVVGLVAACDSDSDPGPSGLTYVALGDSYASGPGLGSMDQETPGCLRSARNYPHLVADELTSYTLVDVSCGGETSGQIRNGRTLGDGTVVEPQLDAVTDDTGLVTLGIGANDASAYLGLFSYCLLPATANDASCEQYLATYAAPTFTATRDRIVALVEEIRERAPRARIVLVGYLRLVPDSGSCAVMPLSDVRRAAALKIESLMRTAQKDAAKTAGIDFVDARSLSAGHDACAGSEAWVNGVDNVPGDGTLLHPKAEGMRRVADEVLATVEKD